MEAGSLKDELLKLNDFSTSAPASSAFVKARSKIKHDAFKAVFDIFNQNLKSIKLIKGIIYWRLTEASFLSIIHSWMKKQFY